MVSRLLGVMFLLSSAPLCYVLGTSASSEAKAYFSAPSVSPWSVYLLLTQGREMVCLSSTTWIDQVGVGFGAAWPTIVHRFRSCSANARV